MTADNRVVEALITASGDGSLGSAAGALASAGVPVFPCIPGGKRPLTGHGFHAATTNQGQVGRWWERSPEANIGVPTGAASGIVILDIDVHTVNGFEAFHQAQTAGLINRWRLLVSTPSGGMHAYYRAEAGQRSWQVARVGIDFRGEGGYVLVPPSQLLLDGEHHRYHIREIAHGKGSIDARALRRFLDPPAPTDRRPTGHQSSARDVQRLATWVASRPQGERNRSLFWAACRLAESGLPVGEVLTALAPAASRSGLGRREAIATIRSAYRTSGQHTAPAVGEHSPPATASGSSPDKVIVRGLAS